MLTLRRVVFIQWVVAAVGFCLSLLLTQNLSQALSLLLGGLSVCIPSLFFVNGIVGRLVLAAPGVVLVGFLFGLLIRVGLSILILGFSVWFMDLIGLRTSWFPLLLGLVLVAKVYWVALLFRVS